MGGTTPLTGGDLTHFVYLDEAGINKGDPVTVVSGPIIESRRAISVLNHMRMRFGQLLPLDELPDDFVISAKDLFHGTKSFKDEVKWPVERRFELLDAILEVPRLFHLTIVLGWVRREAINDAGLSSKERVMAVHATAYMLAAAPVELHMRDHTGWDSVATMVVENNTDTRSAVQNMQRKLRSPKYVREQLDPQLRPYFPMTRVLEDPLFAEKAWSNLMLLGDACSFSICRWLSGYSGADALLEKLLGNLRPTFPPEHKAGHESYSLEP